ncbi:MAG: hypothetical protein WC436_00225 [Candidatus Babeliales bacterium]
MCFFKKIILLLPIILNSYSAKLISMETSTNSQSNIKIIITDIENENTAKELYKPKILEILTKLKAQQIIAYFFSLNIEFEYEDEISQIEDNNNSLVSREEFEGPSLCFMYSLLKGLNNISSIKDNIENNNSINKNLIQILEKLIKNFLCITIFLDSIGNNITLDQYTDQSTQDFLNMLINNFYLKKFLIPQVDEKTGKLQEIPTKTMTVENIITCIEILLNYNLILIKLNIETMKQISSVMPTKKLAKILNGEIKVPDKFIYIDFQEILNLYNWYIRYQITSKEQTLNLLEDLHNIIII